MQQHLLTILILLPVIGTIALIGYSLTPGRREEHYRWIALVISLVTFVASLLLLRGTGGALELSAPVIT
jgi:NADH:ubiquinone oxidoreductase subunit 4 (subunit M)